MKIAFTNLANLLEKVPEKIQTQFLLDVRTVVQNNEILILFPYWPLAGCTMCQLYYSTTGYYLLVSHEVTQLSNLSQ